MRLKLGLLGGLLAFVGLVGAVQADSGATVAPRPASTSPVTANESTRPPAFAFYYIWWSDSHWKRKLGDAYPYAETPVPARLLADGCRATTQFRNNTLLDVPSELYDLDRSGAAVFDTHIRQAWGAGLSGFVVEWRGSGARAQGVNSDPWNSRLDQMVEAVRRFNRDEGASFRLILAYGGLDSKQQPRQLSAVGADLAYFFERYGRETIFDLSQVSGERRPLVVWMGSREFTPAQIRAIAALVGERATLVGNEHRLAGWQRGVADYFDGNHWYWSSQNPYRNPASFEQLRALADELQRENKLWLAPLAPGFNTANFGLGDNCVPRNSGETMRLLFEGNARSNPDAWFVISWNEFLENTYVQPTQRYGSYYLDLLEELLGRDAGSMASHSG